MRVIALFLCASLLCCSGCRRRPPIEVLTPPSTPSDLREYWKIPDFTLTERSGEPFRSSELEGKIWVAEFFYTTCPGPCPTLTANMARVQKAFSDTSEVRLVSITVDPANDNLTVLKSYAERFKATENWYFCTGDKAAIYGLAHDGFKLPIAEGTPESGPITHSTRLMLVDRNGMVRGFYDGTTLDGVGELVNDIHKLLDQK